MHWDLKNRAIPGLCPDCSAKLNYKSKKREVKRLKKSQRKKKHKNESSGDESDCEGPKTPPLDVPAEPSTSKGQMQASEDIEESLWKKGIFTYTCHQLVYLKTITKMCPLKIYLCTLETKKEITRIHSLFYCVTTVRDLFWGLHFNYIPQFNVAL